MATRVAVTGAWGTVEWAIDARSRVPAEEFFLALAAGDQAKILGLFERLAETGRISNVEKFKSLKDRGFGLWEFKSFQTRLIGDFRSGRRFVVAHGVTKKKDELDRADLLIAVRVLGESD